MAAIPYTKQQLIERVKKHINDGFPGNDWNVSDNEILLYLDSAIPAVMKTQMFENAKITGFLDTVESYLVTYTLTLTTKNTATNEWYATLPQPPLALPNGYQITSCFFTNTSIFRGAEVFFKSAKRVGYTRNLPKPAGVFGRIEGSTVLFEATNGFSLLNQDFCIQLPISRTSDVNAVMILPDDTINGMFEYTIAKIKDRYATPKDTVEDNLPAGNKSS